MICPICNKGTLYLVDKIPSVRVIKRIHSDGTIDLGDRVLNMDLQVTSEFYCSECGPVRSDELFGSLPDNE